MESSNPKQIPKNLSTRWKCRPDRKLSGPESFKNKKTRTKRADMKPLNDDQRELAARFLPLARSLARPLKEMFAIWRDEFESAACLALVEAARSFDPSRNIQFATFARFRIRGALVDVGRGMALAGWENEEDDTPGSITLTPYNEEHGQVLVATNPPPVGSEFEDIDAVEHLLKKLPKKHATVCRMQYLYGKTQSEIAAMLGCSQTEIARLHMKALEFLSDPYDADGKVNQALWRHRLKKDSGLRTEDSKTGGPDAKPVLSPES
jgi:RNA polymerase sigma factor (sigma-70 family)